MRKQILDIQDSVRELLSFRRILGDNEWSEVIIRYSLRLQEKLVRKYQRMFGEFPLEIVEVAQ